MFEVKADVKIVWNGTSHMRALKARLNTALEVCCKLYKNRLQRAISIRVGRRKIQSPYRRRKITYLIRSKPGEPPRRETANLWRKVKISIERSNLVGRIWTDVDYAAHLEFGDQKGNLKPRPSWMPTFLSLYRQFIAIIERAA